ncbi:MAG: IS66 family transposase [Saprospiraceae bacterium]|nr:IS66 family transposase [Saprospiraceae bacterium]
MDIAKLKAENEALKQDLTRLENDYARLRQVKAQLEFQLAELQRLIFSSRSERYVPHPGPPPDQLQFDFGELDPVDQSVEKPSDGVAGQMVTYKRKKGTHPGRQAIPDHLPTEEVRIEPSEDVSDAEHIADTIVDTLDYTPASLVRRRYIFPRYVKTQRDEQGEEQTVIIQGRMPSRPLPKSIAEAGLLAHLITSKFVYHLPFYRQIQQFDQLYQVKLSKSTVNDWFAAACTLLEPLYNRLKQKVLDSDYLQADESPIQVQDNTTSGKTHRGYQWVYYAPLEGLVLFDYQKGRGKNGPKALLNGFSGKLQTDGYAVYDKLVKGRTDIELVGCMAHARRYFFQAKDSAAEAETALGYFAQLYDLERHLRLLQADVEVIHSTRQQKAIPVLNALFDWASRQQPQALPKSPFGKAVHYLLQRREKLLAYCRDGRLQIDNNLVENSIRPLALGRKNYLFAGSHDAAQRIAMMYSFFASCKKQHVNPYAWLADVLKRLPDHPVNKIDDLLPGSWQKITQT